MNKNCGNCGCRNWHPSEVPCKRCNNSSHWQLDQSWARNELLAYIETLTSAYGVYMKVFDNIHVNRTVIWLNTIPLPTDGGLYFGPRVVIEWDEEEDFDMLVKDITRFILHNIVENDETTTAKKMKRRFHDTIEDLIFAYGLEFEAYETNDALQLKFTVRKDGLSKDFDIAFLDMDAENYNKTLKNTVDNIMHIFVWSPEMKRLMRMVSSAVYGTGKTK